MLKEDVNVDDLLYDPFDKKEIKKLKARKGFDVKLSNLDLDKVLSYIVLYYDFKSELRVAIPDYTERKRTAMDMAGYGLNKRGAYPKEVEEVLLGKNSDVNMLIIKYMLLFGKPEYMMLHSYYSILIQEHMRSLSGNLKNPKDTIKNIGDLNKALDELDTKLFGGRESIDLKSELYKEVEKKLDIKPEDIAYQLENGEDVGSNPYGDYEVQSPKFMGDK